MFRRRLALVFTALPLAFYAYACGSDDPAGPAPIEDEDGGSVTPPGTEDSGGTPTTDSGDPKPGDGGDPGDAGDAGEDGGVVVPCTGNPLTNADAGADGGVVIAFDGGAVKPIAAGGFLDGPQWIGDAIVYSEVTNQVIVRNGPDGGARAVLRGTGLGNLPIGNGRTGDFIYTALARTTGGGGVLRMLLDGGQPTGFDGGPANSPNDLVASSKGFVYYTDPGFQQSGISTGVFRLAPDGGVTTVTKFDGGLQQRADGIALTEDESLLYVGFFDTKRIARYAVDANGVASNPQDLAFTPTDNPTGIAVDVGGNLWIAESAANDAELRGRVEVIDPTGKKWGEIPFPDARPTGVAFGGPENRTLYITTERGTLQQGTLYVTTSRCSGVR